MNRFTFVPGDGFPVAKEDSVSGNRRDTPARCDDTDQVDRIAGADRYEFAPSLLPFQGPDDGNRLWKCVLLSPSLHKPASPDLAAILHPPQDPDQVAPGRYAVLSGQYPSEDNTVTFQQNSCALFDIGLIFEVGFDQGPPAGLLHAEDRPPIPPGPHLEFLRNQKRPQPRKAIAREQSCRHQFGDGALDFTPEHFRPGNDVVVKQRTAGFQTLEYRLRGRGQDRFARLRRAERPGREGGSIDQGDRRGADGGISRPGALCSEITAPHGFPR